VWCAWAQHRNNLPETRQDPNVPVPVDFVGASVQQPDYWLSFFVVEIRGQDSKSYPANTLFNIVAGIQRHIPHLRSFEEYCDISFFSKCFMFPRLRKSLDCRMKELTSEGVGVIVSRSDPVSASDEIAFWNNGVFNMTTSKRLIFAVFLANVNSRSRSLYVVVRPSSVVCNVCAPYSGD